jgi:hypothetical protein
MLEELCSQFESMIVLATVGLCGNRQRDRQPLLDRSHDASLHLIGGMAITQADRAAVAAALSAGMVHEFVDHAGGDAGILEPGREGMPQVVRAAQLQAIEAVVSWRICCRPAWLSVVGILPGHQAGRLQLREHVVDGAEGGASAGQSAANRFGGLARTGFAERLQHSPGGYRRGWQWGRRLG